MSEQTSVTSVQPREGGGHLVFSALLIALGGLFLLGNFGMIAPLSLRSVLALWPLIPLCVGIQLVLGRDRPSLAFGLQLGAVVLGLAFALMRAYAVL